MINKNKQLNMIFEQEVESIIKFFLSITRGYSGTNICPAGFIKLMFECPYREERVIFGCEKYEVRCWRIAIKIILVQINLV